MASNLILPFATGTGANVLSDQGWATSDVLAQGFQSGRTASIKYNKAFRQSTAVASGFGQFVADYSGQDFTDSLSPQTMRDNFRAAMAAAQSGAYYALDTSASANTFTLALNPVPVTNTTFIAFYFIPANTNTGASTLSLNGNSKPLNRRDGTPLQANDIIAGRLTHAYYHVPSATFRVVGQVTSDSSGITTVVAANSPFGKKLVTNTNRRVVSGSSAGVQQIAWDPFSFTKQQTNTSLLIVGQFYTYTTGTNGAAYIRFNFLNTSTNTTISVPQVSVSGNNGNAGLNIFNKTVAGLAAGPYTISVGLEREDNSAWTTVFLPSSSDISGTITPSVGEIQVEEVLSAT